MPRLLNLFFFLFLFASLFTGCDEWNGMGGADDGSGEEQVVLPDIKPFLRGDTVSRTLLVYLMAENDISNDLTDDFDEIKSAAYNLPDDVRLFVYFDNSDATMLPALYQYHSHNGTLYENVVHKFNEDVCSSDTAVMGKVLDVMFADYPTKAFDLVMGSHATGWLRAEQEIVKNRTIGVDNEKNDYTLVVTKTIEIEELAALLERLPVKVDRLMFDACLMQGVEVAYELRNSANWIIASPAEIPAYGAPYDKVVPEFLDSASGVEDIMYMYKSWYDNPTSTGVVLSAVRTAHMQELADVTSAFVRKYFRAGSSGISVGSPAYVPNCVPAYYDLNSMMKRVLDSADYECWKSAFDKAVPHIMVSNSRRIWSGIAYTVVMITEDAGAVSAYFPQDRLSYLSSNVYFQTTEWYRAAGWEIAGW